MMFSFEVVPAELASRLVGWLDESELRIGLGCMRLSTTTRREATIAAAVECRRHGLRHGTRVRRERATGRPRAARERRRGHADRDEGRDGAAGGGWVADGRAKAIRADCEASLAALDGCRSTSISFTHPIRGRRGARRCARSPGSWTRGSCGTSASRTSTARSSTRRSSSLRSRSPGRAQPVRHPRASRRGRRAVRGARDHADRALAARRPAAARSRRATRSRPSRRRARRRPRRRSPGCSALADRRDPRRDASGDGSVGGARGLLLLDEDEASARPRVRQARGAEARRRHAKTARWWS